MIQVKTCIKFYWQRMLIFFALQDVFYIHKVLNKLCNPVWLHKSRALMYQGKIVLHVYQAVYAFY